MINGFKILLLLICEAEFVLYFNCLSIRFYLHRTITKFLSEVKLYRESNIICRKPDSKY